MPIHGWGGVPNYKVNNFLKPNLIIKQIKFELGWYVP
jgi:hypothetical protein